MLHLCHSSRKRSGIAQRQPGSGRHLELLRRRARGEQSASHGGGERGFHELAAVERDRVGNQVALEVWRTFYRLRSETEADSRSADLVESAAAAEKLALGRYRAGLGILLDVLSAQANLAQARQGQLQTRLGLRVARAELAQAMGELSWDWMERVQQETMQ